jgi:hypothetical protein
VNAPALGRVRQQAEEGRRARRVRQAWRAWRAWRAFEAEGSVWRALCGSDEKRVVVVMVVVGRQRLAPWLGERAGVVLLLVVVVMDKWRRVGVELRRLDRRGRGTLGYGMGGTQQMHSRQGNEWCVFAEGKDGKRRRGRRRWYDAIAIRSR